MAQSKSPNPPSSSSQKKDKLPNNKYVPDGDAQPEDIEDIIDKNPAENLSDEFTTLQEEDFPQLIDKGDPTGLLDEPTAIDRKEFPELIDSEEHKQPRDRYSTMEEEVLPDLVEGQKRRSSQDKFSLLDQEDLVLENQLTIPIEVSSIQSQTIFDTPSSVSVIDRSSIDRYAFSSISEALSTLAGVTTMRTFLMRDIPTIRGILEEHYANKVLVLINGVPSWAANTGYGCINRIDIEDVDRIEVLKGPASVHYGTNAYAGAINLVLKGHSQYPTKTPTGFNFNARLGLQGLSKLGGNFLYRTPTASLFFAANGTFKQSQDFNFVDENGKEGLLDDFQEGSNISIAGELHTNYGTHELLLNGFRRREMFLGVIPDFVLGAGNLQTLDGYILHYGYQLKIFDNWDILANVSFDYNQRDFSIKDDDMVRTHSEGYRIQGQLVSILDFTDWFKVELGVDFDRRVASDYYDYDRLSRRHLNENKLSGRDVVERSFFAEAQFAAHALSPSLPIRLLVGYRFTENELFKANSSLRTTLVYNVNPTSSFKMVYGQAFRAPTLYELYFQTQWSALSVYGNSKLQPEQSNSFELSYLLALKKFFMQALAYYSTYDQKIFNKRKNPDDDLDRSLVYVNGDQFISWGAELEIKYENPKIISGYLSYTYARGNRGDQIEGDHYNFKYIPQHSASFGLVKKIYEFQMASVLNYIHERQGPISPIEAQWVWDLKLSYRTDCCEHALYAKNLFDDRIQVPDYVRRNINSYPAGYGRLFFYSLKIAL